MRNENYSVDDNIKNYSLQIINGGHGEVTKPAALEVLDALTKESQGVPNGYLGLDEDGYVDIKHFPTAVGGAASINLYGPTSMRLGDSVLVEITNYDHFTTYEIESNNLLVERDRHSILITANSGIQNCWFSVNGSVYPMEILVDNTAINGTVFGSLQSLSVEPDTFIKANKTGSMVLVSHPSKTFDSSLNAGAVDLYQFSEQEGYRLIKTFDPSLLNTRLVYTGEGTKKFTAKNQTTTKTDQNYIDFVGVGNIKVEATGTIVNYPAQLQKGYPQYPNGLPPYEPSYYEYVENDTGEIKGFGIIAEANGTATLVRNSDGTYTVTSSILEENIIKIRDFYRVVETTDGQNTITYGAIFQVLESFFDPIEEIMEFECSRTITHRVLIPAKGLQAYPYGLPMYEEAKPAYTAQDKINISSETFSVENETIDAIFYPWEDYSLGSSLDIQGDTIALGSPRLSNVPFGTGGEVQLNFKVLGEWRTQRIFGEDKTPYPRFGTSVKLFKDGKSLLIGAPGSNKVFYYKFSSNTFSLIGTILESSVAVTANYGDSIDINHTDEVLVIGAPNMGASGTIYLYEIGNGTFNLIKPIELSLPTGNKLGKKIRVVNNSTIYALVNTSTGSGNYVIELTRNLRGDWSITYEFKDPSGENEDYFASDFEVNNIRNLLYITAKGNSTTKGRTHAWVTMDGEWTYGHNFTASPGSFGDGFSTSISVNLDGKAGHFLSVAGNTGNLVYLK